MKLHLKLTSVLLSAVMCASMMAPVSVIADETSAPEETHTTEATEKEETKETEKKTPKANEKPEPKETEATEPEEKKPSESKESEPEETKPSETVKETEPTESEDKKPEETEETEPSDSKKEEPGEPAETEPAQTTKPDEDVPETTVTPETGGKDDTHSVAPKNAAINIDYASVTLDIPVVGAKPDYTPVFPTGANYYDDGYGFGSDYGWYNSVTWHDETNDSYMTPNVDVFKANHSYRVSILVTPKNGYAFSHESSVEFNGELVPVGITTGDRLVIDYAYSVPSSYIPSVSINLTAPIIGAKPDYTAELPYSALYSSAPVNLGQFRNGIVWKDITSGTFLNPDSGVFQADHQYKVSILLSANEGFSFSSYTKATVNGVTASASMNSNQLQIEYDYPMLESPYISSVLIGLDAPEVGAKPDYTAVFPSGANYYSDAFENDYYKNNIVWYDVTTQQYMHTDSEVFKAGHQYAVYFYLTPNEGYSFSNSTTVMFNGKTIVEKILLGAKLRVQYTFPKLEGEATDIIHAVSVTIDAPVVGAKPDYTAVFPSGVNYYSDAYNGGNYQNDICWKDNTTNSYMVPENDAFKAGHQYFVAVYLTAKDGYEFSYDTTATVNGQNADIEMDGDQLVVKYTFGLLKTPSVGDIETVDNVKYKVTNANTDGTGTVTLIGMAVRQATVSVPATVEINGFTYKVNRIGTKAFYGDKTIKTVYIGNNIVIIDSYAFYGCSNLTKVSGGKALKTIGSKAFAYCSKLKTFSLTSAVLYKIGTYAFQKDKKLKTVYIKYTTKLTKSGVKKSLKSSSVKTVKVKKSKVKKYKKYFKKSNSGRSVKVKK